MSSKIIKSHSYITYFRTYNWNLISNTEKAHYITIVIYKMTYDCLRGSHIADISYTTLIYDEHDVIVKYV